MKQLLFAILLITQTNSLLAQQARTAKFRIVQMPVEIERSRLNVKNALNNKIQFAKNRQEVFKVLNDSLKTFKNLPVKIREQLDYSAFQYYTYNISAPTETSLNFVEIKASRSLETETISYRTDFKQFFPDTLAILDTLKISIIPEDFNFKINEYFILANGADGSFKKLNLTASDSNNLLICESDFKSFTAGYINCSLFNSAEPGKALAIFRLTFPDAEAKAFLKDLAHDLMENDPGNPDINKQLMQMHLTAYIKSTTRGTIKESNMEAWIKTNL